jgi:HEAT repeat protein
MSSSVRIGWWWRVGALMVLAGCGPPRTPYPKALVSERPEERARAVKRAGESNDRSAVPALVERLLDDDEAVRFYAILALERLTGTRLGYDYRAPEQQRQRAVERWRRYVQARGAAKMATCPAGDER